MSEDKKHLDTCGCDHEHGCDCGCEDPDIITLDFGSGEAPVDCEAIGVFPVDGKDYIALAPVDEESDEIYLYEYHEIDKESFELLDIEDDAVFEKVQAAFEEIIDEMYEEEPEA